MNDEAFNMSLRKFLKVVGVTSQQEIEKAVRAAVADGRLKGTETLTAKVVLTIEEAGLNHTVDGQIALSRAGSIKARMSARNSLDLVRRPYPNQIGWNNMLPNFGSVIGIHAPKDTRSTKNKPPFRVSRFVILNLLCLFSYA